MIVIRSHVLLKLVAYFWEETRRVKYLNPTEWNRNTTRRRGEFLTKPTVRFHIPFSLKVCLKLLATVPRRRSDFGGGGLDDAECPCQCFAMLDKLGGRSGRCVRLGNDR